MLNEGIVVNDSKVKVKSEIIRQIRETGSTTPDLLEQAVFKALTGGAREDVDWGIEDNQAGYFLWLKSFDGLIGELVDDGHILVEEESAGGPGRLVPAETDSGVGVSQVGYA